MSRDRPSGVEAIDPVRLRERLGASRFGRRIEVHHTIDSTNDRARSLGRAGGEDGSVVLADSQTRGRGRRGRVWESPGSTGIYVSVLLRGPGVDGTLAAALQLAAGVAVSESIAPHVPRPPELLWPNDCVCDGAKVAGVLVEGDSGPEGLDFLVCGIGVNVNQSAGDFSPSLRGVATSIRMLSGAPVDRTVILADLLRSLEVWEDVARRQGPAAIASRWEALSPSARDHEVELDTVDGRVHGISAGLADSGALRVVTDAGTREVFLGELIRVRRKG